MLERPFVTIVDTPWGAYDVSTVNDMTVAFHREDGSQVDFGYANHSAVVYYMGANFARREDDGEYIRVHLVNH